MNPGEWKNDPRLAAMDPVKLQYIEKIAAQISSQSKAELFPALLSLQADARKSNISFTDQETTLLISIITSGMPPDEKKKIEMLHFLAKKLDELGLPCILTIEGVRHKIAQTIVENTAKKNQSILALDSMQSTTSKDVAQGTTYLSVMEKNLDVLTDALG